MNWHRQFKYTLSKRLSGLWTCSLEQPWQSRGKKEWKVCGLVEEKIHRVYIYSHSSRFFGVVISKITTAAVETIACEGGGSLPDDERAPLKTPGWSHSGWVSRAGQLRRLGGCCGWSTCRTGFRRTASFWIPGGEIPRQLPLHLDSQPSPRWRSHGTHPTTWKKKGHR